MIQYSILINDNDQMKVLHVKFAKQQIQDYINQKYSKPRYAPMNLYGVYIPDYELEKPEVVAVLKGHVKEKKLQ
jgi:hypothetical protein